MISSSKVLLRVGKLSHKLLPTLCVSTFYVEQLKSFILDGDDILGVHLPRGTLNFVRTIVSRTSSYIVSFNSLCWAVEQFKSFIFGKTIRGSPPRRAPKFCPNNCLINNFLLCEFQLSMLSSSKVSFLRPFGSSPRRPPNLVKIIVSPTTSYIVSFNFIRQAVQNGPFLAHILEGSPLTWSLIKTICKQPTIGLYFHQLSDLYIKRSRKNW